MLRRSKLSILLIVGCSLLFSLVWPGTAFSQNAQRILSRVGAVYANLKSYQFDGNHQTVFEIGGTRYRLTTGVEFASAGTPQNMGFSFRGGKFERISGPASSSPGVHIGMPLARLYRFYQLPEGVESATFLKKESLRVNGKTALCLVIRVTGPIAKGTVGETETLWVDQSNYLVLQTNFSKLDDLNSTNRRVDEQCATTFMTYVLNAPSPAWLHNVQRLSQMQDRALSVRMTGKAAPGFTLQNLKGQSIILDRQKGSKLVLLDFWAPWCGPCREEEPVLEKLQKDWGPDRLAVLRIATADPDSVRNFLAENHEDFPTLVDGRKVANEYYHVRDIPTLVVIDRSGKIASYHVGYLDEASLNQELKKAGIH